MSRFGRTTIKLGDYARDTITSFEGTVVAVTEWLHGCRRITLQPHALHDGRPIAAESFDEPQVELVKKTVERPRAKTGGPRPEPTRR